MELNRNKNTLKKKEKCASKDIPVLENDKLIHQTCVSAEKLNQHCEEGNKHYSEVSSPKEATAKEGDGNSKTEKNV